MFLLLIFVQIVSALEGDTIFDLTFSDLKDTIGWDLTGTGYSSAHLQYDDDRVFAEESSDGAVNGLWYFIPPLSVLAAPMVGAYNGKMVLRIGHWSYNDMGLGIMNGLDVIMVSSVSKLSMGIKGVYSANNDKSAEYQIILNEDFSPPGSTAKWEFLKSGSKPTKTQFISCLESLSRFQIRGSYYNGAETTWLQRFALLQGNFNGTTAVSTNALSSQTSMTTCISRENYKILFDRPGCQLHRGYACSSQDTVPNIVNDLLQAKAFADGVHLVFNQNIGDFAKPIKKPFEVTYTFNNIVPICGSASLEVTIDGDIGSKLDQFDVYGEDNVYLGSLFKGNLSRTNMDFRAFQNLEIAPFVDSLVISASAMNLYTVDGQVTFRFKCPRGIPPGMTYVGEHRPNSMFTDKCSAPPCDLSGVIIFRKIILGYSPTSCLRNNPSNLLPDKPITQPSSELVFHYENSAATFPASDGILYLLSNANLHLASIVAGGIQVILRAGSWEQSLMKSQEIMNDKIQGGQFVWRRDAPQNAEELTPQYYGDAVIIPRYQLEQAFQYSPNIDIVFKLSDPTLFVGKFIKKAILSFALKGCFIVNIKKGANFGVHLVRPSSQYFAVSGVPTLGSDLFMTIRVEWQDHARYTTLPGGNHMETPMMRADKNPMGINLDWKNYPDKIEEHKKWPHGHSYLQVRAGVDGELLANAFLSDFSQYSTQTYIVDTVTISRQKAAPWIQNGVFTFTIWIPPGSGVIVLRSVLLTAATTTAADQSEDTSLPDLEPSHSHGPVSKS